MLGCAKSLMWLHATLQVGEAEEEEQMQVDNIKQQETQLATAKKAAGLARWRRLQVSICTCFCLCLPVCLFVCSLVYYQISSSLVAYLRSLKLMLCILTYDFIYSELLSTAALARFAEYHGI